MQIAASVYESRSLEIQFHLLRRLPYIVGVLYGKGSSSIELSAASLDLLYSYGVCVARYRSLVTVSALLHLQRRVGRPAGHRR